jgi:hypothetical protein
MYRRHRAVNEEEYFRDKERLCVVHRRQCNPAKNEFCQCWWESDDPLDWNLRYEQAQAAPR